MTDSDPLDDPTDVDVDVDDVEEPEPKDVGGESGGVVVSASEPTEDEEDEEEFPDEVDLRPPDLRTSRFGIIEEIYRIWRYRKKRKKLLSKGYVEWRLVGDAWPRPKFVKPKQKGGGMLEHSHDDGRYLFPQEAMLPSKEHGMNVVIHRRGDAEPLNPRNPTKDTIPADTLDEYVTMQVSTSAPGFFDNLDLDMKTIVTYAIGAFILFAVYQGMAGGGF